MLILSDRLFSLPAVWLAALWFGLAVGIALAVWRWCGPLSKRSNTTTALVLIAVFTIGLFGYYKIFRRVMGTLGRHLPVVTLLAPKAGDAIEGTIELRAHAVDEPGALGPIGAVRSIEFWLYHPSFAEQHSGNHESKVLLGEIPGPTSHDEYETTWTCRNPYTPLRDGDHSGGDGTRTYTLPRDERPYMIQAHGLDDEWRAKPGRPGFSERVTVNFSPCAPQAR